VREQLVPGVRTDHRHIGGGAVFVLGEIAAGLGVQLNIGAKLGVVPTTMTLARCRAPNFTVMVRKARVLTWAVCGRPASGSAGNPPR